MTTPTPPTMPVDNIIELLSTYASSIREAGRCPSSEERAESDQLGERVKAQIRALAAIAADRQTASRATPEGWDVLYTHELLDHEGKPNGVHLGVNDKSICEQAYDEGETSREIRTWYATPAGALTVLQPSVAAGVHDFASQPSVEESLRALVEEQQSRTANQAAEAPPAAAWIPRSPAEVREFLGSHCSSMTYGDPSNPETASENDHYDLTAHDLLSAFVWAGHFDDEAPSPPLAGLEIDEKGAK